MGGQPVAAAPGEAGANCEGQVVSTLAKEGVTPTVLAALLRTNAAGVTQLIKDLCAGGTPALAAVQKVREAARTQPPAQFSYDIKKNKAV
jgi:hypothetical protein